MLITIASHLLFALASFQDPTTQTPGPQTGGPMMWTGELRDARIGVHDLFADKSVESDPRRFAAEVHRQLDDLRTRTELSREFGKQVLELDGLRGLASWKVEYANKAELAADIAVLRADWLEKLGRHAEAVYAAQHAYVMPEETGKEPYTKFVWIPSNGTLAELVNRTDALPQMVELHKRFPSDAPATKGGDAIEEAVRRECLEGTPYNLVNFGTRCVPALVKILRENPKAMNDRNPAEYPGQPLAVLMQIDRAAANSFLLSTLGTRGPDWTLRAIFCLSNLMITKQGLAPSPDPYSPNTSSDSLTLQVVDAIAREGLPAPRFLQVLEPLVGNDIVSPAVRDFLLHQVQATDPGILSPLRSMLDGVRVGPNKRVLYEGFLDSPDSDLRSRCARALAFYDVGPATLRAAGHADANVRQGALHALVRHSVSVFDYVHNSDVPGGPRHWVEVEHTPEIAAALMKLARDPETSVRLELVSVLRAANEEPAPELLELLLTDSDKVVRGSLAADWAGQCALQARVLARLAGDTDPVVLDAVGRAVAQCTGQKAWESKLDLLLPALTKLLENPAATFGERELSGATFALKAALQSSDGARAVFEACAKSPHRVELLPELARQAEWARNGTASKAIYDVLDAASLAQLFAAVAENPKRNGEPEEYARAAAQFARSGQLDAHPFLELARDDHRSLLVRLCALRVGAAKDDPAVKPVVLGFLRGAKPEDFLAANSQGSSLLQNAMNSWSGLAAARGEICADASIPDPLALLAVMMDSSAAALDAAATRVCLQRWARLDEAWKLRDTFLFHFLDPRTEPRVLEQWKALYRDGRYTWEIADAMARFPTDESVPMLAEMVRAEWLTYQQGIENVRNTAIAALTKRLDELGADALLKAIATAPSEEVRKKCFDGLEQIRKYQDEKQNWQTRRNGTAARDAAVAELLPMLDDADPAIRASAARSLATLRATEHLPKLVRLLKDKEPAVRDAAQKALDALNAPEAKKP